MHIGGLYMSLINERVAHMSGGVFFLRIEDTDKSREVEGAKDLIANALTYFGVPYDEGARGDQESGAYRPYTQSERKEIYITYVRKLLSEGKAYPCFATPEELKELREMQSREKINPGYYGQWAIWRDRPIEDIREALDAGKPFVIRLKSPGVDGNRVVVHDLFKGDVEQNENVQDIVLLKQDSLPTYHFAHVVDDHLMGTTDVMRADEWLSSTGLHMQLFAVMGWEAPRYGHLSPIAKQEGGGVRKLSKRKDPEASVVFYDQRGYPQQAVLEYLMNLANSSFEGWRKKNPDAPISDFPFTLKELQNRSWALFDEAKLNDISREILARMSADDVYEHFLSWVDRRASEESEHISGTPMSVWRERLVHDGGEYAKRILAVGRGDTNRRKDFIMISDIPSAIQFYFDDYFEDITGNDKMHALEGMNIDDVQKALDVLVNQYTGYETKEAWMEAMKSFAVLSGFAPDTKSYKAAAETFKGSFGDFAKIIRVALAGKNESPDLYEVMTVMGKDRVIHRFTTLHTSAGK